MLIPGRLILGMLILSRSHVARPRLMLSRLYVARRGVHSVLPGPGGLVREGMSGTGSGTAGRCHVTGHRHS